MRRLAALAVLAALLATVLFVALPDRLLWQRVLEDAGHAPVFAGVALAVYSLLPNRGLEDIPARCWRAFGLAVAFGVGTELGQKFLPNHDASVLDAVHDAAGAAFALALLAGWHGRRDSPVPFDRARSAWLLVVVLASCLIAAWEPLQCARAYGQRHAAFPVIAPVGAVADAAFIGARHATIEHAVLPGRWAGSGVERAALKLTFDPGSRPALEIREPPPDWRGHDALAVDVTNPGDQPVAMILRVLDAHHDWSSEDRLNLPVVIDARTRVTVRVSLDALAHAPAHRLMDLSSIANVMLFARAPVAGDALYVSSVRLE